MMMMDDDDDDDDGDDDDHGQTRVTGQIDDGVDSCQPMPAHANPCQPDVPPELNHPMRRLHHHRRLLALVV